MSRSEYDANQALGRMDVDQSMPIQYLGDEAEDDSPHQSLINDAIDFCKGALILAVCTGLLGFVVGFLAGCTNLSN